MTQNKCTANCACPVTCEMAETDPTMESMRTVSAGSVCGSACAPEVAAYDMAAGTVEVPIQMYVTGFCPAEALCMGTLFPELVSPYTRGC